MRSHTRTLLCLAAFAATTAQAQDTYKDGVIYCKADVLNTPFKILSVSLPASNGYSDYSGNPCTVWNIGEVPPGGVADTFFSDKGPGAFQVKNDGNRGAFLYVVTGSADAFPVTKRAKEGYSYYDTPNLENFPYNLSSIFGEDILTSFPAQPVDRFENGVPQRMYYRLAVSTDVTGKIPAWRPLNWAYCHEAPDPGDGSSYCFREFQPGDDYMQYSGTGTCYQYLSYLASGETQLFDLKFFAPTDSVSDNFGFIVIIEASEFRLWQHDL